MKILISESQLENIVRVIKEQENDEYYEISAEDYQFLMKAASYNSKVTEMKKFKGKPLYVVGNVDLNSTPTKSLGNVAVITGTLNISRTEIADVSKTDVKGYIWDNGSPREKIRHRKEELKKLGEADGRREDGDWDLDNPNIDEQGLAANAIFDMLVGDGALTEMDEDVKAEIESKKERIEELVRQGAELDPDSEEREELYNEIDNIQEEIEELQGDYADVYYLIPVGGGDLHYFEVIGLRGREYMAGRYDDVYDAAVEDQEQLLDDVGLDGLPSWLIEDNLDKDQIRNQMEEYYRDDVSQNPEIYFDDDDFELTDEQEERKEELENYINEMEDLKTEKKEELENTEDEDEIADLEREIEEIEDNIEKAQDELDNIEPDTEPTDEMIDGKVYWLVKGRDPLDWLKELGSDLKDYVDIKGVAKDIVDSDGIQTLSRYDGQYDEQILTTADGKKHSFIVMRMN